MLHGKQRIIAIVGPTCSGKSAISIPLAQNINGAIINCDSMQQYKYMDIGTDKLSKELTQSITHYMISVYDPSYSVTVAEYQNKARNYIKYILKQNKIPILVGGSSLYIRAILDNFTFPSHSISLREELNILNKSHYVSPQSLYKILQHMDKNCSYKINSKNKRRILRAIEIFILNNDTSNIGTVPKYESIYNNNFVKMFAFNIPFNVLIDKIQKRVHFMYNNGLLEEVQYLIKYHNFLDSATSQKAIGYKEVIKYLNHEITLETSINTTIKDTIKLVKEQLKLFKKDPRIIWINANSTVSDIFNQIY